MEPKALSAVIIHGLHLETPEWERLVWGSNDLKEVGRIVRGIEVAIKENVDFIVWGTGASEDAETRQKESEVTLELARNRITQLAQHVGVSEELINDFLTKRSFVQCETQNTKQEVQEALALFREKGVKNIYLVSSPTHVPRCLLTAIQCSEQKDGFVLYGVAAETATNEWHPKDVSVVEPAHRADRSEAPMNLLAKRMARARKHKERAVELHDNIKKLLDEFDEETERENA
ncbi:MAG: YdcF family protein [Candidatus Paceibacteria bacterium]